jgi:heme exporter protein C
MMRFLPSPRALYHLLEKSFRASCILMAIIFGVGIYGAFFSSPADYQQEDSVRIMYLHVPASWMALAVYGVMALSSFALLIWRHPLMGMVCRSLAPIGATFTLISLITGSIWGKPMWGVWWVWDARLTSVLVLFFLYLGYMALVDAFEDENHGTRMGAFLCLLGAINLPIIKWSVTWWATLHQPSSFRGFSSSIHPDMMWPLLTMAFAYGLYAWNVLNLKLRTRLRQRLNF